LYRHTFNKDQRTRPFQERTLRQGKMKKPSFYGYWGKSWDDGNRYHLLAHHCLDVAAVLLAILDTQAFIRRRIERISPLPLSETSSLLAYFACLHDIGKFSFSFQYKLPELAFSLGLEEFRGNVESSQHTRQGMWLYAEHIISALLGNGPLQEFDEDALFPLAEAAFGHHGKPTFQDTKANNHFKSSKEHAISFCMDAAGILLSADTYEAKGGEEFDEETFRPLSWLFAGLLTTADWIASNELWFKPSRNEDFSAWTLEEYWKHRALPQAKRAVEECGLSAPKPRNIRSFHDLLPHLQQKSTPTALQQYALGDAVTERGPQLHILEDLTGGGKTEAALLIAHGLMLDGEAQGFYVGLPTMATSNAMYARLAASYRALFEADDRPSLMLAHSANRLSDEFLQTLPMESAPDDFEGSKEAETAGALCNRWLADNRKKALLAPCGAGTLDQALLSVLPVKHQCMRLFGVLGKVLIADEVHAYDPYTSAILCNLLRFQAMLGGSAVLLSATLPMEHRQKFLDAFADGAGYTRSESICEDFPLAVGLDVCGLSETPIPTTRKIRAEVELTDNEEHIYRAIVRAAEAGACVCWIRNTVDQARETYERLIESGDVYADNVLLFHARFTQGDRAKVEQEALDCFGKASTAEMRRGKVLLCTQVFEQSIDADTDLLISDLTYMDLMLQRLGRCHRHTRDYRPKGYENARLMVLSPDPVDEPTKDWYGAVLGNAQYVYPCQSVLWLTARLLKDAGEIALIPDERGNIARARELVETAYGRMGAPEIFVETDARHEGRLLAEHSLALANMLLFDQGYSAENYAWHDDSLTPTRLGEDTLQLRLLKVREDGSMSLFAGEALDAKTCARSEVRVAKHKLGEVVLDAELEQRLQAFKESLPDKGKWCAFAPMRPDGKDWVCSLEGRHIRLRYNREKGLMFE
jgi:CRISPR-associated endonuclease/helicase Cas3